VGGTCGQRWAPRSTHYWSVWKRSIYSDQQASPVVHLINLCSLYTQQFLKRHSVWSHCLLANVRQLPRRAFQTTTYDCRHCDEAGWEGGVMTWGVPWWRTDSSDAETVECHENSCWLWWVDAHCSPRTSTTWHLVSCWTIIITVLPRLGTRLLPVYYMMSGMQWLWVTVYHVERDGQSVTHINVVHPQTSTSELPLHITVTLSSHSHLHSITMSLYICRLRNDLYCVEWDVKLYYIIPSLYNIYTAMSCLQDAVQITALVFRVPVTSSR